jgi:uncharacterized protein (TIGR03067 family)
MTIAKALLSAAVLAWFTQALIADPPKDDAKEDVKKLQGTWKVIKLDDGEKPTSGEEIGYWTFEFNGDGVTTRQGKNSSAKDGKFKLDSTKKPKSIDIDTGGEAPSEGIYELDGDELTICIVAGYKGSKTAARPTEFKANEEKKYSLFVLKKVKE